MPEKLTLNDGTELNGHAQETDDVLFLYMHGITLPEAVEVLKDPEKTMRIVASENGQETVYEGFGHLYTVTEGRDGTISAGIKRGVVSNG